MVDGAQDEIFPIDSLDALQVEAKADVGKDPPGPTREALGRRDMVRRDRQGLVAGLEQVEPLIDRLVVDTQDPADLGLVDHRARAA